MSTTYSTRTNGSFQGGKGNNAIQSEITSPTKSRRADETMIRNKGEKTSSLYRNLNRSPGSRGSRSPTPMKTLSETVEEETKEEGSWNVKSNEFNVFNTLCESVMTGNALLHSSVTEILDIKDELCKHNLPPSLLLRIILASSRLFRSMADLDVPINELVRLVRTYAVPWEEKSEGLKRLHSDYDSKLRQLNVALRKLELVGVHAERMQKEQNTMHWERMYIKLMTASGRSRRWKFLIPSLKKKLEEGVDVYNYYANPADDEEIELSEHQDAKHRESADVAIPSITIKDDYEQQVTGPSRSTMQSRASSRASGRSDETEARTDSAGSDGFDREFIAQIQRSRTPLLETSSPEDIVGGTSTLDLITDPTTDIKAACVPMDDAGTWTHEREFEKYLHIKLYKPVGFKDRSFSCVIQIRGNSYRSKTYEREPLQDLSSSKDRKRGKNTLVGSKIRASSIVREKRKILEDRSTLAGIDVNDFEEFVVHIPHDPNRKDEDEDKHASPEDQLNITLHDAVSRGIIAVGTIDMDDLNIMMIDETQYTLNNDKDLSTYKSKPTLFPLYSTHITGINSPPQVGQLPLACVWEYVEIFKQKSQSTETLPLFEMIKDVTGFDINEGMEKIAAFELERTTSREEMSRLAMKHAEEMQRLQDDYEKQLEGLKESLTQIQETKKKLEIQAARQRKQRSILEQAPVSRSPSSPHRSAKIRLKVEEPVNPSYSELPATLPIDFFERMEHFTKESLRRQEELVRRTQEEIKRINEQKLASQFYLAKETNEETTDDVCLPALFMPTQLGHVYNPRAHLYFNPTGSKQSRVTQPPSMSNFKLPELHTAQHIPIVNLFDLGKSFTDGGIYGSYRYRKTEEVQFINHGNSMNAVRQLEDSLSSSQILSSSSIRTEARHAKDSPSSSSTSMSTSRIQTT